MTTDPTQPESQHPAPEPDAIRPQDTQPDSPTSESVITAESVPETHPGTPVEVTAHREEVPAHSEVSPVPVSAAAEVSVPDTREIPSEDSASDDPVSAAARIRERMASASDRPVQTTESDAPRTTHKAGAVEIPSADELDASLEAEISSAMSGDAITAPISVTAEGEESKGEGESAKEIGLGSKVRATVQAIHSGEIFLDAGLRNNVVVSISQFGEGKQPAVGDQLDVIIDSTDADGLFKGRIPRARHRASGNWDSLAVGQVVDCHVTAVNKGGLQVTVSNLRAFLPASQVELGFAGNLEGYVGQKLSVQVTEVNAKKRNLVVSRRALLQAERSEGEGEFWSKVEVGQDYRGTVKTLKDYGAFVNIGVVDGFLHIGEISWSRINHPKDVLAEGQEVDVKILKLDPEKKRVSLGMKQLAQNPWQSAAEKYSTGRTVTGTVTRITEFGAFIELEPGLEGMVHISELAWRRVGSVGEILKVGETRDFQVVEVDTKRKRVSLSLKALEKRPEPPKQETPEEPEPAASADQRRPRNTNLRGGTGTNSGGRGLFGNPNDFT